ncbi:hypothetical protein C8Q80DRAFT_1100082, partial [Daedaleopsis nitida]
LGVTCDNASNNNMIKHLTELLPDFAGEPNRIRCFAHMLNLVAKSLIPTQSWTKKPLNRVRMNESSLSLPRDPRNQFEEDVHPVKLVMAKVSQCYNRRVLTLIAHLGLPMSTAASSSTG